MNRFAKQKSRNTLLRQAALPVLIFAAVLALFFYGVGNLGESTQREQLEAAQRAVARAAVQCYASEGFYPPTVEYLTERYGLAVDEAKYYIDYQCFAANIMPDITVVPIA